MEEMGDVEDGLDTFTIVLD